MDYTKLVDPAFYADNEALHALLAHMRANDAVPYIETSTHRPFYAVTKHADIVDIARQHDKFLNTQDSVLQSVAVEEAFEKDGGPALRTLIHMDDPDHSLFRNLTKEWFMPANLKQVEKRIQDLARTTVDRMLAMDGEIDFVKDIAVWYPLRVIMMILGVEEKDEPLMLKLTQELFGAEDPDMKREVTSDEERMQVMMDFFNFFTAITDSRRANPGDDVATVIANAEINGEPIGHLEAMSYYIIIATAGHDTTSSSTAGGLLALIQHPEQLAKLQSNADLLPYAIDEMIRWVTPVKHFLRHATEDYPLRDKTIRKDERVMLCYQSGNFDEEIYDDPFSFRVDRRPNRHVAFGYGAHHCLGNVLAKLEMRALFAELLPRIKSIELTGEPKLVQSTFVSGLKTLPVRVQAA